MAQTLFEALAAGVAGMDTQTAMAVQSLLESQTTAEPATQDDDDVFQCGKCKKQFNSLSNFVTHKQSRCAPPVLSPAAALGCLSQVVNHVPPGTDANGSFTASVTHILNKQQNLGSYNPVGQSPLTQALSQGMVLTDDLMPYVGLEQAISNSTLQVGTNMPGNPFLSQISPLAPRSNGGVTCPMTSSAHFATIATHSFASGNSAFTSAVPMNAAHLQQVGTPQSTLELQQIITQEGATGIGIGPPKMMTLPVVKPTAAKMASPKMSGGGASNGGSLITVITDLDTNLVTRHAGGAKVEGGMLLLESVDTDTGGGVVKKKLKCQYCDKLFTKNFDLQQHVRSHTGEKPFQCIVCGRAFAQKSNVKKHMQTHKVWPQGAGHTLPEQPSPELMEEPSEVVMPPVQVHNVEVDLSCSEMTGVRSRVQISVSPENDESDPKSNAMKIVVDNTYICQYCAQKFKSYFQLKTHMVEHKSEQVYKCIVSTCSVTFTDLDSFLEHTKTHENEMNYRCHVCNKHFPSLYELGVHQYSHSLYPNQGPKPGPKHFRCVKCNSKYATPEALHHHMVTTSHKFACPHCSKMFTCERFLRRHLPTHGTVGEYECDVCKKCFKTDHYLKMHSLIHSGEKPFVCDQCNAAFNRKDKLSRHLLIHEPNKKYKCPFKSHTGCMKAFNRPDKLKAHIITHSGIKPYQCTECGKSFSRRPHLMDHERQHRCDYRYSCLKCGKGFLRMQVFKRHQCHDDLAPMDENAAPLTKLRRRGGGKRKEEPRKRIITVTEESIKAAAVSATRQRRGRPRKTKNVPSQHNNVIIIQPIGGAAVVDRKTESVSPSQDVAAVTVDNDPSNTESAAGNDAVDTYVDNGMLQQPPEDKGTSGVGASDSQATGRLDGLSEIQAERSSVYCGEMTDNMVCGMATLQSLSLVPTGHNSAKLVVGGMLTADGSAVVSMSDGGALGGMQPSVTYVSVPVTSIADLGCGDSDDIARTYVTDDDPEHGVTYGMTATPESVVDAASGHTETEVTYVSADTNGVVHVANPSSLLEHAQTTDTVAYLTAAHQNMAAMVTMSDAGHSGSVTYVTLEQLAQYQAAGGNAILEGTDALLASPDDVLKSTSIT